MLRRTGLLALMCATIGLLGGVGGAATAHAADRLGWMGVMADGPLTAAGDPFSSEWDLVGSSGVSFVRTAVYWDQVLPDSATQTPDWRLVDQVVGHAAQQRLDVLPVVLGTPDWAAVKKGEGARPKDPADYAAFLKLLIARYGPKGEYWAAHPELTAQPIRSWQVWNEPSLKLYWNQDDWTTGYTTLLKAAHKAIRAADPKAKVVMAGLPNFSWKDLNTLYKKGARTSFDVAAIHPYTGDASGVLVITKRNRLVMDRHGDKRKQIWLTETTWPTSRRKRPNWQGWEVTEAGQSKKIREALPLIKRRKAELKIGRVSWYTWASEPNGRRWESYAGLRTLRDGRITAKPGYGVFRSVIRRLAK